MTIFEKLYAINVNEKTENKEGLKYLSWSWAWAEFKKACPDAHYTIWRDEQGRPYVYDENLGYMVFVEATAGDETHSMWLPVMDSKNKAMKAVPYEYTTKYGTKQVAAATMFDINTAIMRCLTKCLAMFGLGLYIYAGEDLPHRDAVKPCEPATPANIATVLPKFCTDNGIDIDQLLSWYKVQDISQMDEGRCNHFNHNYEMFIQA